MLKFSGGFVVGAMVSALVVWHLDPSQPERSTNEQLFITIASLDNELFDAFNDCNLDKQQIFLSEDIEFYHDKGGLTTSRQDLMRSAVERCANQEVRLRRELVAGSLEVYPVEDYGAIEKGAHRFYVTENGHKEALVEIAQFVHVWHKTIDGWQITRVLSYGHKPPQ